MPLSFFFSFLIWLYANRPYQKEIPFEQVPQSFIVDNSIEEASGLANSRMNPGHLWVHEDGGSPAQLLLLKTNGTLLKSVEVTGALNTDWEDMALANGPDASMQYIYLADIGDNQLKRPTYTIYRFEEPGLAKNSIQKHDEIKFKYPARSHDAEAILVDNKSKDIYVITKSDNPSHIYKIPYPQSTTSVNQAIAVGQLPIGGITGAAISKDGKEIILKTYPGLHYFSKREGETIEQTLKKPWVNLSYQFEPQGEAVGFASDNSGFYTLSERGFGSTVRLFYYKRK